MFWLLCVIILAVLIWLEVLPMRRWLYEIKAKLIGAIIRSGIDVIEFLDNIDKE